MLSLVIPVFNENEGIEELVARLRQLLESLPEPAEVIFVDDHSSDDSPAYLRNACRNDARFHYLRLARNSGSHIAILAGLKRAQGDCAVFLAADLQDPPELVPQMLALWREGAHVVWAVRAQRDGISRRERMFSQLFYGLLNRFSEVTLPPRGADFALLDRRVIDALIHSVGPDPSIGADIATLGFRQTEIPYTKAARRFGSSKWTMGKKLKAFADAFVGHSFAPIRFMSYAGMLSAVLGFGLALLIIVMRLMNETPVAGWASLMVVVLVMGGLQMTMLGVLGEYLYRTLREARGRPLYIIEDEMLSSAPPATGLQSPRHQVPADEASAPQQ